MKTCEAQRIAWTVDTSAVTVAQCMLQRIVWLVEDLETTRSLLVELWKEVENADIGGCPICGESPTLPPQIHRADCRLQAAIVDRSVMR